MKLTEIFSILRTKRDVLHYANVKCSTVGSGKMLMMRDDIEIVP